GKEGGWNGGARQGGRQGRAFASGMALAARIGWGDGRSRVVEPGFDRERALELLEALGREAGFLQRPVTALSGGEAQITALVRALLVDPQILLLDEPTASLDEATARAAEDLIARWREAGPARACIWTSHDRDQLRRVVDRQVALAPADP
ncbi:MAG TPA: ATP-binding cassette domain-containing protein, partial [Thermaerobacter sp.]